MQAPLESTPTALRIRPIVERPRLTRLLDRNKSRIKTLIAPAGYGKSTLAEQWMVHRPHAWYPCTAASSDVAGLAHDLAALIIEALPQLERELRMHLRVAAQSHDLANHFTEVMVEHFVQWPDDRLLVIDDYQLIAASADSEALFEAIVERTTVPLLITARTRPAWASARQLLYGDIYELEQKALAITRAEAAKLLAGKAPAVTRELTTISRGWPAILSLGWHADPRMLPKRTGPLPSAIARFIADEIFGSVDPEVVDSLVLLALANCRDGEDFESLVSYVGHATITMDYLRSSIPMQQSPDGRDCQLLHPLIAKFLKELLPIRHTKISKRPGVTPIIDWLLTRAMYDNAFALACSLAEHPLISDVVSRSYMEMASLGRSTTLRTWLDRASRLQVETAPIHLLRAELALQDGDYLATEAFALLCVANEPTPGLRSRALFVAGTAAHLRHDDKQSAALHAKAAAVAQTPADRLRSDFGACLALSASEDTDSLRLLEQLSTSTATTAAGQLRFAICSCSTGRSFGNISGSRELCERVRPMAKTIDDPLLVSSFMQALAYSEALGGAYQTALDATIEAVAYCKKYRLTFALPHIYLTQSLAQAGLNCLEDAERSIELALRATINATTHDYVEANASVLLTRVAFARGDFDLALSVSDPSRRTIPELAMRSEALATHGLALAATGDYAKADELARRAANVSRCVETSALNRATALLVEALEPDPLARLERTMVECKTIGCIDPLRYAVLARPTLALLVTDSGVIEPWSTEPLSRGKSRSDSPTSKNHFRLTPREREICRLISDGMTNHEIAKHLFIADSTAKVHVRHVLDKLGVKSRAHAVAVLARHNLL